MVNFHKLPNEITDLKTLKDEAGRDCDFDGNKAALIRVKAQGFNEKTMLDFTPFQRPGIEIIHKKYQDGEMWLYVSSGCQGTIIIKYMGEFEFKLPSKLDAKGVYELILGIETATLVIRVIPSEAEIFIDNQKVGTGEAISAVSIGAEHRYRIVCKDYYTKEGVVFFDQREEKSVIVELEPNFSYITIKTEPSGADVLVDGKKVGVTPYMSEKISFGQHRVELQKAGYEKYVKVVVIKADELENTQLENVILKEDPNYVPQPVAENLVTPTTQNSQNSQSTQIAQSAQEVQSTPTEQTTNSSFKQCFSVSPTKKVNFSKGNLQYQASTQTWRFAEHQWDIIGDDNEKVSKRYSGWIDLFGWGTGSNPTKSTTNHNVYVSFSDWGNNNISNGSGKKWFTITKDE